MEVYYEHNKKQISFLVGILLPYPQRLFFNWSSIFNFLCYCFYSIKSRYLFD